MNNAYVNNEKSYKILKRTVIIKLRLHICIVVHFFMPLSYSDGASCF